MKYNYAIDAIDISTEFIETCKKKTKSYKKYQLYVGDAINLPLKINLILI